MVDIRHRDVRDDFAPFSELIGASLALVPPNLGRRHKKPSMTAIEAGKAEQKRPRITLARPLSVQAKKACNEDYYDHDTDDVENIHCVLQLRCL